MAQQNINLGTPPNAVDGDTFRTSMEKVQANTTELYGDVASVNSQLSTIGAQVTVAQNMGSIKNLVINGNFDFWQRGTTSTGSSLNGYVADRWRVLATGSTGAFSQQAFIAGQGVVPNEPAYWIRAVVTSVAGAANVVNIQQFIEDVRLLAGQKVTVSFWAKADANRNIAVELSQYFGTSGSASVNAIGAQLVALTAVWQKFTVTIQLPAINGMTIGTGLVATGLAFWFDAGANYATRAANLGQQSGTFDIAQVQLEVGSSATSFDHRPLWQELQFCQRYFEKTFDVNVVPANNSSSVETIGAAFSTQAVAAATYCFKVSKRVAPSIAFYSSSSGSPPTAGMWQFNGPSGFVSATSMGTAALTTNSVMVLLNYTTGGLTSGYTYLVTGSLTADADF